MAGMSFLAATDWNEVTAISTAALALLTFMLVIAAIIAAVLAKRDIDTQLQTSAQDLRATRDATRAAQTMAQRQIQESYRPLLIEVSPTGPVPTDDPLLSAYSAPKVRLDFPGGHIDDVDPRQVYVHLSGPRVNIAVPLRNVGNGLAVIAPNLIMVLGQRVGEMSEFAVQRQRVPPGETTRILCAPRLTFPGQADYPWALTIRVQYTDFVGGQASVVTVHLEQRFAEDPWLLRDVEHEPPGKAIPLA
jgi:hypothetical protein